MQENFYLHDIPCERNYKNHLTPMNKCYCGIFFYDINISHHLNSCNTYKIHSKFYQAYLKESSHFSKESSYQNRVQKNANDMKIIIEEIILGHVEQGQKCLHESISSFIDKTTVPQSYFVYKIEDFSKLTKLELIFLKAELDLIIDDIKLGYSKEPRFQVVNSGIPNFYDYPFIIFD